MVEKETEQVEEKKKRKILFRGKRKRDNKWVYGVPVKTTINCYEERTEMVKYVEYETDLEFSTYVSSDPVKTETIGQFTGLYDKNGKEIFEGDIVKLKQDFWSGENSYVLIEENEKYEVYYDNKGARFDLKTEDTDFEFKYAAWKQFICQIVEVIGNIYDNPELLEVK